MALMRLLARSPYPLALAALCLAACADPYIESTTELGSSADISGPYRVQSVVVGGFASDTVDLMYNPIDNQPQRYIPLAMVPVDDDQRAGELFEASIPGQPAGTTIRYYIRVLRDGDEVALAPVGGDLRPFVFRITP